MNFISPANHPESYLSGSTIESMVKKTVDLNLPYFACTDNGSLISVLRAQSECEKHKLQLIPGIEIFFKDNNCSILKEMKADSFKYSKLIIHAKDQGAYQKLVTMVSDSHRSQVTVGDQNYGIFNWSDIEDIAKYNVTIATSNVEDMSAKYLLVNRRDVAEAYFTKLKELFQDRFYISLITFNQNMYWNSFIKATVGGEVVEIPANSRIETNKYSKAKAIELTKKGFGGHSEIRAVYINNIRHAIKEGFRKITSVKLVNKFEDMPDVQTEANKFMLEMASKHALMDKVLFNSYSYYTDEDDKVVQDMKLGDSKRLYQKQYIMSLVDAMPYLKAQLDLSDAAINTFVKNSYEWATQFDNFKLKYDYRLPAAAKSPQELLIERVKEMGRMQWGDARYVSQFREELELLTNNGVLNLIPYFLPIVDIYDFYAKNGHLTGPARGSAGGFLISYLIGITHVDPIKYGLSSSRFLTLDRVQSGNLPDIDCDLEDRAPLVGRDGNSGYLFNKYGKKAAQVSTRTLLRIKSAILDANRFVNHGKVEKEIEQLSKSLPTTPQGINDQDFVFGYEDSDGNHVEGLIEVSEDLQKYATERPEEWNIVTRALSLSRQNSRHACAFIISDTDIENTVPIMEVGGVKRVTQPEHKECEAAGLIKYDFLVVSALKDINLCLKYINKKHKDAGLETGYFKHDGSTYYIWDLPEDLNVFKTLWKGSTETVFQLNSTTATPLVKKIKPESVLDCAVITSLGRPGPLDFIDEKTGRNMAEEYAYRKSGISKGELPILEELLPETYGILVFQEQVTKIALELGKMSVIEAENVRIGMGKKKIKLLNSLKPKFIDGASKQVGTETAEKVWSMMSTFARYGFNKSHAVAYSVISYACAFLKHHYPLEWWASVLSNADDKEINEVFYRYVKDMVLPPDINTSTEQMEVDYNTGKIRNKLSVISGLGEKAAEKIISKRPYKDLNDFIKKDVCGPALTRKLTYVGALDSFFEPGLEDITKLSILEQAFKQAEFDLKMSRYKDDIQTLKQAGDTESMEKKIKLAKKAFEKGPKKPEVPASFLGLSSKQAYQLKKSVFPTMNLDLMSALKKTSSLPINVMSNGTFIIMPKKEQRLLDGEHLQAIDQTDVQKELWFVVPGYIINTSEFTYSNNSRKALRLVIDSSGYISEKVLWPDYNTGDLVYDPELKKGAIVYILYNKKPGKPYTNIREIYIEEPSIL